MRHVCCRCLMYRTEGSDPWFEAIGNTAVELALDLAAGEAWWHLRWRGVDSWPGSGSSPACILLPEWIVPAHTSTPTTRVCEHKGHGRQCRSLCCTVLPYGDVMDWPGCGSSSKAPRNKSGPAHSSTSMHVCVRERLPVGHTVAYESFCLVRGPQTWARLRSSRSSWSWEHADRLVHPHAYVHKENDTAGNTVAQSRLVFDGDDQRIVARRQFPMGVSVMNRTV